MIHPYERTADSGSIHLYTINWAKVEMEHLDNWDDFNLLLDELEANGVQPFADKPVQSHLIYVTDELYNKYFLEFHKNGVTVRWLEGDRAKRWLVPRQATIGTTTLISPDVTGYRSFYKIINWFKKTHRKEFSTVFGGGDAMLWKQIRRCIPRPVNYGYAVPRILSNVYKADISSAYAFEGSKSLPTLIDYKRVAGREDPSPEYPFVFYLRSHHIAIYNELDTREFLEFDDWYDTREMYSSTDKEISICCRCAEDNLKSVFTHYYDGRTTHPEYKQYMNLFVGYCYRMERPEYSHISAVILARSAMRILKYAAEIQKRSNLVRLIATDSVLWVGQPVDFTTDKKYFGAFVQEYSDIQAVVMGAKKYQLLTSDNEVITRWAGVKSDLVTDMKFGGIMTSKLRPLMREWDGHRFVIGETSDD